jgi:hypothetical protein
MQAPGELDRHIEDLLQLREPTLLNPVLERSSLHILGEDRELRSDRAEKPAGDEVGMLGEIEPGLQLTQEIALARRAGRGLAVRKSEWGKSTNTTSPRL